MSDRKALLLIMDGWGIGAIPESDAILAAHTPFVDSLYKDFPNSTLLTCGNDVGLPAGQMGNSEVGHLNIGAGRIVYQELQRINEAISSGSLAQNPVLQAAFTHAITTRQPLHLMGLVSNGGVHSSLEHLKALCTLAHEARVPKIAIHAFTDGRDTDPQSAVNFIHTLSNFIEGTNAFIATICGRYYAMDRDKRWERVRIAYDCLVRGAGTYATNAEAAIKKSYTAGITDEFLKPVILTDAAAQPLALIAEGDTVLCFNFRTDRCREITQALTQQAFPEYGMGPLSLHYVTMTEYDKTYRDVGVIFHTDNLSNTLGAVLDAAGKRQIRMAETEKYPHVTFFFSGGRETVYTHERRIMVPSPTDVATYDLKPEMSAPLLTEAILHEVRTKSADFICLNFANADMVGHTGVWSAAITAAETVDACVARIVPEALAHGYAVFLTADHGNSDLLLNPDGSPNTAHTLNPVPFFLISNDYKGPLKSGRLADIAPSILAYMGITIPAEMTGEVLLDLMEEKKIVP